VLNKKEDRLTEGNKKKVIAQHIASVKLLNSFFAKTKIKYDVI
jgi:hypothetical protein